MSNYISYLLKVRFNLQSPVDIVIFVIDILLVMYLIYTVLSLVKETRAYQIFKGIIFLIVITIASDLLNLRLLNEILRTIISSGVILLIVVFQPELRKILEQIGRNKLRGILKFDHYKSGHNDIMIVAVVNAVASLSRSRTGALLVFERDTKLGDIIKNSIEINANVSKELILTIFAKNTPLHDGAVIIRGDKIKSAASVLPLTDTDILDQDVGTRHRAGVGVSEVSDAIVVIVSEESGIISIAQSGKLIRNITSEQLKNRLTSM